MSEIRSEIRRESLLDASEKLLFDILQELKEIKQLLKTQEKRQGQRLKPQEALRPMAKDTKCKHCGMVHENKGQELACAKKHKKQDVV